VPALDRVEEAEDNHEDGGWTALVRDSIKPSVNKSGQLVIKKKGENGIFRTGDSCERDETLNRRRKVKHKDKV